MLIESIIRRAKGTHVKLGDDIYHFFTHLKDDPRHVCQVEDEDHIQTFLAVKEGYRIAKVAKKAQPAQPGIGVTLVSGEGGAGGGGTAAAAPAEKTDTEKKPGKGK